MVPFTASNDPLLPHIKNTFYQEFMATLALQRAACFLRHLPFLATQKEAIIQNLTPCDRLTFHALGHFSSLDRPKG